MSQLRPNVVAAKEQLTEGLKESQRLHDAGASGIEVCTRLTDQRDAVLRDLVQTILHDLGESGPSGLDSRVALVAHAGYGRRDVAPYSDVDLMILHRPEASARVTRLAERLLRDVFDIGLVLGHSVRTPAEACELALKDPQIYTSLVESRLLWGDGELFEAFRDRFRRCARRRTRWLTGAIEQSRLEERIRFGDTVFLLEPNIKRSSGSLREIQLLRWIGFVRYGQSDPQQLRQSGVLAEEDLQVMVQATEFLLRLRNEMHFHAGRSVDVLGRSEQLRIAEVRQYVHRAGMLPVELFMRDYFRHTSQVSHLVSRFVAKVHSRERVTQWVTAAFGRHLEGGLSVGPRGLVASRKAQQLISGNLGEIMRLVELANFYDQPIAPATWEVVRRNAARLPQELPPEACRRFLSLLAHSARLGPLLRALHEAAILERFLPEFEHARGLLQFNQYHKYTVDEHSLRAVECATDLASDAGPLGRVYRQIEQKHVLHLALLIHDLGKGFLEDHRELGLKIAAETGKRLDMPTRETEILKFLVHKHLLMNHLAFRRDTSDEQLVVRFAVQVGSPELLRMLYVLTAADLASVGPGVLDGWKIEILTELYHNAMQCLAGESPATVLEEQLRRRREAVRESLGSLADETWFARQIDALPASFLNTTEPCQAAADLQLLFDLPHGQTTTRAQYVPETKILQLTIGTSEDVTPGIFHKLTGSLSSRGLEIRSAQIHTLADGLVLDRFSVHDPDYADEPPPERLEQIRKSLVQSLHAPGSDGPTFRRTWRAGDPPHLRAPRPQTRVNTDNSTSDRCTVLDVFSCDRPGLLYAIARTVFELGLSVWRAKIGTYLDQVVDVFYVTDQQGRKIKDEEQLEAIRQRLLEVLAALEQEPC